MNIETIQNYIFDELGIPTKERSPSFYGAIDGGLVYHPPQAVLDFLIMLNKKPLNIAEYIQWLDSKLAALAPDTPEHNYLNQIKDFLSSELSVEG